MSVGYLALIKAASGVLDVSNLFFIVNNDNCVSVSQSTIWASITYKPLFVKSFFTATTIGDVAIG